MEKTQTKTGLSVAVNVLNKVYKTGRKVADNFKNTIDISKIVTLCGKRT